MLKPDYSKYTLDKLLRTAIILVDTREQENSHILNYFDSVNVPYAKIKLDYGDYSMVLPKNEELGILYDMRLDFAVERKHNLEEISGNFSGDRDRIEKEFWRGESKMFALIENAGIDQIIEGKYNTKYNPKSFVATLFTYNHRYNIPFYFCDMKNSGKIIYTILYYKLREELNK